MKTKLVLDTNVLIGLFDETSTLHTQSCNAVLSNFNATFVVPVVVLAEFLMSDGNTALALSLLKKLSVECIPATTRETDVLMSIPYKKRAQLKATDCLILAHCINEKAELLTFDENLQKAYKKVVNF